MTFAVSLLENFMKVYNLDQPVLLGNRINRIKLSNLDHPVLSFLFLVHLELSLFWQYKKPYKSV